MTEISNILLGSTGSGMLLYGLVMLLIIVLRPGGVISFFRKDNNSARIRKYLRREELKDAHS